MQLLFKTSANIKLGLQWDWVLSSSLLRWVTSLDIDEATSSNFFLILYIY
jgi:hypothetical protein